MEVDIWGEVNMVKQQNNLLRGSEHLNATVLKLMMVVVVGLFSFLMGASLLISQVRADDTTFKSPFNYSTTLSPNATYSGNQAINMKFLLGKPAGIQAGDQIKISMKKVNGTAGFDMTSLQINAVSSGNFFNVSTDPNSDPATVVLTAKAGVDYGSLAKAGVSIYMKPSVDDANKKATVQYPVEVTYNRGNQSAKIDQFNLNVNNIPGDSGGGANTLSQEIFGGLGGLTAPSGFNAKGESPWDGNFYAYTAQGSDVQADENLLYWYSQNATVAWAQITLPSKPEKVPKSFTWTLSSSKPESNPISDPKSLKVYENPNNTTPLPNTPTVKWTVSSVDGKVVFKIDNLGAADAGRSLNIPFAVKTSSVNDKLIITSKVSDISNHTTVNDKTAQMMYNSTIGAGFIPLLQVNDVKVTLSNARKLLFNNNSQTLKPAANILSQFASTSDNNDPQTTDTLNFGYGYDYQSTLAYNQIKAGQTYTIPIYASNENGDTQTKYAKLTVTPDTDQLTNLNASFVDVDGQTSFPNNNFTLTPTADTKLGDTWNLTKILTYGTIPAGYHLASGSELNGKVQPTVVWGTTGSPVQIYVKKNSVTPTPNPSPTPNPTPSPTPTPSPSPTPAPKGTVVYALKKIFLYQNTTFSTQERRAGYVSKPRVYRPMFVVTGYGHSTNGRLRYQMVVYVTKFAM